MHERRLAQGTAKIIVSEDPTSPLWVAVTDIVCLHPSQTAWLQQAACNARCMVQERSGSSPLDGHVYMLSVLKDCSHPGCLLLDQNEDSQL